MMNSLMIFEGKEVEVFEFNGQVLFNPYHCGRMFEFGWKCCKDGNQKDESKPSC